MNLQTIPIRLRRWKADFQLRKQLQRVEAYIRSKEVDYHEQGAPVLFFNTSTRISRLSMNAAFSLLASWAVRVAGVPVHYVECQEGMIKCVLGTKLKDLTAPPPCKKCMRFSDKLFPAELVLPLTLDRSMASATEVGLRKKALDELSAWEDQGLPLGEMCVPSLGWALRRYHLQDDETTPSILRQYLISAVNITLTFEEMLDRIKPRGLVVFNGITYPEAVARAVALRRGIPVITHEVGLRPFSAFFSHSHATFRELELPPSFKLGPEENQRLDEYLEDRFRGRFTMAGIRFWPQMQELPQELLERIRQNRQMVVVFTNVIFDTSQVHANTIYEDMFAWLKDVKNVIGEYTDTLFIIRAHPDENRPGKASRESVSDWITRNKLEHNPNVVFYDPSEYISSYQLIQQAKFIMVYNSSIGLEASIMGVPVLCAGRARYTQIPTVFFPDSRRIYLAQLHDFLERDTIEVPAEFIENARRFLSFELYHASLDFERYLEPYPYLPGFVTLSTFDPSIVFTPPSSEMKILADGILRGETFAYSSE